jgi:hypothetical protein
MMFVCLYSFNRNKTDGLCASTFQLVESAWQLLQTWLKTNMTYPKAKVSSTANNIASVRLILVSCLTDNTHMTLH